MDKDNAVLEIIRENIIEIKNKNLNLNKIHRKDKIVKTQWEGQQVLKKIFGRHKTLLTVEIIVEIADKVKEVLIVKDPKNY